MPAENRLVLRRGFSFNSWAQIPDKTFMNKTIERRRYPRRRFTKPVGVLCSGQYMVCPAEELGEGGLSFRADFLLSEGKEILLSFQVPNGDFYNLRCVVRNQKKIAEGMVIGISFKEVSFALKRQIRAFVSARSSAETHA